MIRLKCNRRFERNDELKESFNDLPAVRSQKIRSLLNKYGRIISSANYEYEYSFEEYLNDGNIDKMISSLEKSEKDLEEGLIAVRSFINELQNLD